nr:MAG TPA: hypothetical protein [Caudoviricetes sp.]
MSASTNWDPALSAEQRHPPFTKLRHFPVRRRLIPCLAHQNDF